MEVPDLIGAGKKDDGEFLGWEEAKHLVSTYPEDELLLDLKKTAFNLVRILSESAKRDNSFNAPEFLYRALPNIIKAIEDTPWGYYKAVHHGHAERPNLVKCVTVYRGYSETFPTLTAGQMKFRTALLVQFKDNLKHQIEIKTGLTVAIIYHKDFMKMNNKE